MNLILQKHVVEELTVRSDLLDQKVTNFRIAPKIRFRILPQKEKGPLIGAIDVEIGDMDGVAPLYIRIRMRGIFLLGGVEPGQNVNAETLHKQALLCLFPYVSALIGAVTMMGGLPPISLPPMDPNKINLERN